MYGIGEIVYGLGYSRSVYIISVRLFSAFLGAGSVLLVYYLTRKITSNTLIAALAGLLVIASGVVPANARFGHNDFYLQLFSILCIYFLINYQFSKNRLWSYASFFAVGLAASSKYTGGSLILAPLFILIVINWEDFRTNWLQAFEMIFIGLILSFLGYAAGTPKSLLWMSYYFKRVIPALTRYPEYGLQPNSVIGLFGQWGTFIEAVGSFVFLLFILSFLWFTIKLVLVKAGKVQMDEKQKQAILILLVALIFFDLPFMISVNYIPRYFIPFVPFFSILAALFVKEVTQLSIQKGYPYLRTGIYLLLFIGISYSLLRSVSTALLFMNDARMAASEYVKTLRAGTVIEYTLYPPIIPKEHFYKARNYPIFFIKYPGQEVPTDKAFQYNQGEAGLIERQVDYLVIDTFTYTRLWDPYICKTNPVECDFFKKLLAGQTHFRLIKEFAYKLPSFLPQVSISAVNPEIRIYEYQP
jgi:4-amino-4-deoxy-L-arabinose transferase-like glycosyltransferase